MFGPFWHEPLTLHVSSFMTRDKPDSATIVDLSWPKSQSVNSGVAKDMYLGSNFVTESLLLRPGSLLCKVDYQLSFLLD